MRKKRRWMLPFILMMILVPTALTLFFSGYGLYRQQRAMADMASRYAQSLARTITQEESVQLRPDAMIQRHRRMGLFLKMLTLGPPVPGWIAIAAPGGIKLQGSPGSQITEKLAEEVDRALASGEMRTLTIQRQRGPSSVAICPYPDGLRAIVVVISHYLVPGPLMRFVVFQPVMSIAVSLIALIGIFLLWRWCILPLRKLSSDIEGLHWGQDILSPQAPGPLPELEEMQSALAELSSSAADREALKKKYVSDIVKTQEEERTRLAREIHDSPLQTVASLIQRIQLALRALAKDPVEKSRVTGHLSAAQDAALTAVQEMRDVCDRLSPPWITLGAVRAIEEIANRLSRVHSLNITSCVQGDASQLSEKDVLALCRIIQEAAANSARHGEARSVEIRLLCTGDGCRLTVTDDGKGISREIDPEVLRVEGHRGIASMTERASLIGARFSICPGSEGGTVVTVDVPGRPHSTAS